jgi:hypothetical protein
MIAGELEGALGYDNFFSLKNKGTADKPKMNLLQKAGKAIDKAGGVEGIGRTIDSGRGLFRKSDPASAQSTDYQFGLKQEPTSQNSVQEEQNKEKQRKEKEKLIITGVLIVSGIILIGGLIWYFNRQKQVQLTK